MMVIVVKDRHVSIDVIMMINLIYMYGSIKVMMMLAMMEVSPMLATYISSGSQ